MKKIAILLTCILLATACEKNNEPEVFRLDPEAMVYVKASTNSAKSLETKASPEHLTPLEVVRQATVLCGFNSEVAGTSPITWTWVGKDTISEIPALLRWGTDVIYDTDGYGNYGLQTEFLNATDLVICSGTNPSFDTIAYIPHLNMTSAKEAVLQALEARDTIAVYQIFTDAFKFIPITGTEWRQLKAQGLN